MFPYQLFVLDVVITTKHTSGAVRQQFQLQPQSAPSVLLWVCLVGGSSVRSYSGFGLWDGIQAPSWLFNFGQITSSF